MGVKGPFTRGEGMARREGDDAARTEMAKDHLFRGLEGRESHFPEFRSGPPLFCMNRVRDLPVLDFAPRNTRSLRIVPA